MHHLIKLRSNQIASWEDILIEDERLDEVVGEKREDEAGAQMMCCNPR
jgi:hypothetical protein